jgi:hypothetical protein
MFRFVRLPIILAAALFAIASAAPASAQSEPRDVFEQLLAAANRDDAAAAAALFTEQAVLVGGPCNGMPNQTCRGRAMIRQAFDENPARVTLRGAPEFSATGVQFALEERFELPPPLVEQGVDRYIEVGTAMFEQDKVAAMALAPDFTDQQTLTAYYAFTALGPEQPVPAVAEDGQTLAMQPAATQLVFLYQWGDRAAEQWAKEHNAQLNA